MKPARDDTGSGSSLTRWLETAGRSAFILRAAILALIYVLAFSTRLFSILRFESVIHEFDPYFNFRTTKYLVNEGFYSFHNWFDDGSWYPLGRIIGGTIYPGLMITAAFVYWTLHFFHFTVAIRNVCVLLAPWMASNTTLATYLLAKEVNDASTGLVAAAMIAIVPGYISRSVAGSFDNEGVAIFALIFTFYLWVKAVKTGSMFWAGLASLGYFYMVSAWGGYIFIINLIPLYVVTMVIAGRFSYRLYLAYSTFYVLGTLLSMQITFVGFQPVRSGEHMAAMGTFMFLQVFAAIQYLRSLIPADQQRDVLRSLLLSLVGLLVTGFFVASALGFISPWTGRFYSLFDPTYAKENIPIIASVSEHQPTTWSSFFFDLHILVFLFPAGLYFCFAKLSDANIFIILYGVTSVYFAGVMVRLMLVLAPIACILSAIAVSETLKTYTAIAVSRDDTGSRGARAGGRSKPSASGDEALPIPRPIAVAMVISVAALLLFYTIHCSWVTSEAYSSPSIVLAARQHDGGKIIFDDFREAYSWLNHNTAPDAKIMSWWDYGYQITAMANRTILVDNNTWNNTHIAQVGRMMASTEEVAYPIMRSLDVDYVLVIFGGLTGYASDDINKFLWMVRIGGGVFPEIVEKNYFSASGEFRVDKDASKTMLNCLMYKLCYYRFGQVMSDYDKPTGWDRVRNVEIGNKDFELEHLEEAYTTQHWLVRIYRVKPESNRV